VSLRRLSASELASYHDQGFLIVPGVFTRAECAAINQEVDRIIVERARERGEEPTRATWVMQLGLQSTLTRRLCADERFLTLVEDIVHPGIAIYSAKLVPKAPGDRKPCVWHQDDAFYSRHCASDCRMSVWLALHDSDAGNGGVHFLPGSHRWGLQPWEQVGHGYCSRQICTVRPEHEAAAVCPPVAAGSVVLFSALTWHRSLANTSQRFRRSFIVSYQEATTACGNGEQWQILRPADGAAARA